MTVSCSRQILVVEDEEATRRLLARQLQAAGYEVVACEDGRAAMQELHAMRSGIVLADWSMPEMDGIELCHAVRELEEMQALGQIYFILLTANDSKDSIIEGLASGANDYLTKPYHKGELLARIEVGERLLRLQEELLARTVEVHKANAALAAMKNKLEEFACMDAMTNLANRRFVLETLDTLWERNSREDKPLSCIMLDVDHFKGVNDQYGHAAGDAVLVEVARDIRLTARREEHCGRLGGEEFLVICSNMHSAEAVEVAEDLRLRVCGQPIKAGDLEISVSISAGVAERTPEMASPEDLIKLADARLYQAKESGRNRTVCESADTADRVLSYDV
jgi:two-component system cell cycle response regulator